MADLRLTAEVLRCKYDVRVSAVNDINQLEAMHLADVAWQSIDTTTIRNCWRKSGILSETSFKPPAMSPSVPVSMLLNSDPVDAAEHVEKDVSDGLDELERMGLIQPHGHCRVAQPRV